MGNSALLWADVPVPGGFTPCLAEVSIGVGGMRLFGGSIYEIVVDIYVADSALSEAAAASPCSFCSLLVLLFC